MKQLKLINLNIEGDKHLKLVTDFLKNEKPDIVCLQEALSKDVRYFKELLGMEGYFAPTVSITKDNKLHLKAGNTWGVMILTNQPSPEFKSFYYAGSPDALPEFKDDYHNSDCRVLVALEFPGEENTFTIATTHFTWSEGGNITAMQRDHLQKLISVLDNYPSLILTGDFNAPRGREIWSNLAERYRDNIPPDIQTTIDQHLHRKPGIQLVVDGIFSTPEYEVANVEVKAGVSDHMAVIATVSRK